MLLLPRGQGDVCAAAGSWSRPVGLNPRGASEAALDLEGVELRGGGCLVASEQGEVR